MSIYHILRGKRQWLSGKGKEGGLKWFACSLISSRGYVCAIELVASDLTLSVDYSFLDTLCKIFLFTKF